MRNANTEQFEIVCCLELGDAQVYNHLMPLAKHPLVSKIWIIRSRKPAFGVIPKSECITTDNNFRPLRWLQMLRECRRLAKRPQVKAFLSFNPIPYGLIAAAAARPYHKPVHYGFIGTDWYRILKGPVGLVLRPLLRRGAFFTVTGNTMKRDMIEQHFDENRIVILPHSIDLDIFQVSDPNKADYSFVFVGRLIPGKRVDIILKAFKANLNQHPQARLCIVGEGPDRQKLESLGSRLGIADAVDFIGYSNEVANLLRRARIIVMASDQEGLPFALVEAMCSGLVPITTPAGTICDLVKHEYNGLLIPCRDVNGLAQAMSRLLKDSGLYWTLRRNVLLSREEFSYSWAVQVWDRWLSRC